MSLRLCCLFLLALLAAEAFAQSEGRPLSPAPRLQDGAGDVDWTLTFEKENRPGSSSALAVAPAPDRGVCVLSGETFGPDRGGAVLARYAEDGTLLWEQPVSPGTASGVTSLDVAAVDDTCVAAVIVYNGLTGYRPTRLRIVRAGEAGALWSYELSGGFYPLSTALLEADGRGGVWVGFGSRTFGHIEGLRPYLLLLDADGNEVRTLSFDPPKDGNDRGMVDLAALPNGGVIGILDPGRLLLVGTDAGSYTFIETDAERLQTLDVDDDGTAAYVVGYGSSPSSLVAQRYDLQQNAQSFNASEVWRTELDYDSEGGAFLAPHALDVNDDALYVFGHQSVVSMLSTQTGAEVWASLLPDDTGRCYPRSVHAEPGGVIVGTTCYPEVHLHAFDKEGTHRWRSNEPSRSFLSTTRVTSPCGDAGVCTVNTTDDVDPQGSVRGLSSDGSVQWEAVRQGQPSAYHTIDHLAAAPGGGVYGTGITFDTEAGRPRPMVVHIANDGTLEWALEIEDLPHLQRWYTAGLDVAENGDVVVTGPTSYSGFFARRLTSTGDVAWMVDLEGIGIPSSPIALDDGGALLVVNKTEGLPSIRVILIRKDRSWTDLLDLTPPGNDHAWPHALEETPGGYVASTWINSCSPWCPYTFAVHRFTEDGELLRTDTIERVEGYRISRASAYSISRTSTLARATDTDGNLYVGTNLRDEAGANVGPALLRIAPEGVVTVLHHQPDPARYLEAVSIAENGEALLRFRDGNAHGVTRLRSDGSIAWEAFPAPSGVTSLDAVNGPGEGALTVGSRVIVDEMTPAEPLMVAFRGADVSTETSLSRLADLSTEINTVAVGEDGIVYAALRASGYGSSLAGIARISNAFSVGTEEAAPSSYPRLLTALGPNPLRAGAPLRFALGAPADLALYDLLGRRVAAWDAVPSGDFEATLPARLAAGLYMLRAESEDTAATLRVTVLR